MKNEGLRITLNDGNSIPRLGFGVWQVPNESAPAVVGEAFKVGYRSVDTAQGYDNESGVGEAIRASGLPRDELFITTKLRNSLQGYDAALAAFDQSMERLGLETLDLFLIHWPMPAAGLYLETWKAFVRLQQEGRVRSIGVSNFRVEELERISAETGVLPAVNQIELHPAFQQRRLTEYHRARGIATESWSPLGRGKFFGHPVFAGIAAAHGVTPAQAVIRWHLDQGFIVIPKTVTPARIAENFDVFGWELTAAEAAAVAALDDPEGRTGPDPSVFEVRF